MHGTIISTIMRNISTIGFIYEYYYGFYFAIQISNFLIIDVI